MITKDLDRSLETTAKRPQVAREAEYYLKNIEKVKSIDDFLKNDRLYNFAMKAHGLEDMTYAKAFIRKVLKEGITDKNSFANKLADSRYRKFAEAFDFQALGGTATMLDRAQKGTVEKYVRQTLEEETGVQNEGARLALYFARKAPDLTSAFGILADKALIKVMQTALQIPPETSFMDIDKQAEMIEKKLGMKVTDLKDPEKLDKFLNRFTSLWELSNSGGGLSLTGNAAVLFGGGGGFGISSSTLAAIQNLKLGGG
jgi:hypothetical protein